MLNNLSLDSMEKNMRYIVGKIIICCMLFSLNVSAQEQDGADSVCMQKSSRNLMGLIRQVPEYLDKKAHNKVDTNYIEVPAKPWRVILRYKENSVDVDYTQSLDFPEFNEHLEWELCFEPPRASSLEVWVGYHGTGVGLSLSLAKNAGRYFSFSSTGAKYGFNFRLRRFNTSMATFTAKDYVDGNLVEEYEEKGNMHSPVWIRSVYANGYYVFNGRHYSQAAAYNQSVIQRRSAGSFLLGATWYQSSFDYSDVRNALYMLIGHGIHRIKVHQANIGFGYGYNFVPTRGLVINAMVMPNISLYNRVKVYKYDFNYDLSEAVPVDDYGQWDSQARRWANGETYKSIFMAKEGEKLDYWDLESETDYSPLSFNIDLRFGIAYNWRNYFIGIQAQLNRFSYKNSKDNCKVRLLDGYARASFGVRL